MIHRDSIPSDFKLAKAIRGRLYRRFINMLEYVAPRRLVYVPWLSLFSQELRVIAAVLVFYIPET
jgi:hypothetical protein